MISVVETRAYHCPAGCLWVLAILYTLLISIQRSLQILSPFISLIGSSDWNCHHQKGNYPISMLTRCHFFFCQNSRPNKVVVLYMGQISDQSRNMTRVSNMLMTWRKKKGHLVQLYICFQFEFRHFSPSTYLQLNV